MLLNEDQRILEESAIGHLKRVAPISRFREKRDKGTNASCPSIWYSMAEMGWTALLVPEEFGGLGLSVVEAGIIAKEMGRNLTVSPFISSAVVSTTALTECQNSEIKESLLLGLVTGEKTATYKFEKTSLNLPLGVECVTKENQLGIKLSAELKNIFDIDFADYLILLLDTESSYKLVCLDLTADEVKIKQHSMMDGRSVANVSIDGLFIEQQNVLAIGNDAYSIAQKAITYGQSVLASEMLGSTEKAFEITNAYLKERKQFGALIGTFQALQHRAAKLYIEIKLAEALVNKSLVSLSQNKKEARNLAIAAKSKMNDVALLMGQEGVQLHGGIGMTDEHDIGLFLKRNRTSSLVFGKSGELKAMFAANNDF